MPRLSRRALRAWSAGLHGGQLLMLWVLGLAIVWAGFSLAVAYGEGVRYRSKREVSDRRVELHFRREALERFALLPQRVTPLYATYLLDRAARLYVELRNDGMIPMAVRDSLNRAMPWAAALRDAPDSIAAAESVEVARRRAPAETLTARMAADEAIAAQTAAGRWVATVEVVTLVLAAAILGLLLLVTWDWLGARARPRSEVGGTDA